VEGKRDERRIGEEEAADWGGEDVPDWRRKEADEPIGMSGGEAAARVGGGELGGGGDSAAGGVEGAGARRRS
jgi:hypothetical protein